MNLAQLSFAAGEINVRMENRLDVKENGTGLSRCENVLVTNNGSAIRRPGTDFVTTTQADYLTTFLYQGVTYLLAFGNLSLEIYPCTEGIISTSPSATLTTPTYLLADLGNLSFAETQDALYIACKGYQLAKLYNTAVLPAITWTWAVVDFTVAPPSGHNGTTVKTAWTQTASPTKWPTAICNWRGRLWLSGQSSRPSALGASNVKNYELMTDTYQYGTALAEPTEENAIDYYRSGGAGNARWILGQKLLYQGTDTQEMILQESVEGRLNPNTYTRPIARYETHGQVGSTSNQVVSHSNGPIHINGNEVRIITYSTERQAYTSESLSNHAGIKGPYRQMVSQSVPFYIIWLIADDGTLYALTYEPREDVIAWSRHYTYTPGVPGAEPTMAKFRSVAVVRAGIKQYTYFIVERGATKYIERQREIFPTVQADSACLDCAKTVTASTIDMTHLAGKTVGIMEDGGDGGTMTASGAMSIPGATKICAGIPYDSIMITPPKRVVLEGQLIDARKIRATTVALLTHQSMGLQVRTEGKAWDSAQGRQWTDVLGSAPEWVSGEVKADLNAEYGAERISIKSTGALPFEVTGIVIEAKVSQ